MATSFSASSCSSWALWRLRSLPSSKSDSCCWGHSQHKRSAITYCSKFTSHRVRFLCSSVTCTKHQSKYKPVISERSYQVVWTQCILLKPIFYPNSSWPNNRNIYPFFSLLYSFLLPTNIFLLWIYLSAKCLFSNMNSLSAMWHSCPYFSSKLKITHCTCKMFRRYTVRTSLTNTHKKNHQKQRASSQNSSLNRKYQHYSKGKACWRLAKHNSVDALCSALFLVALIRSHNSNKKEDVKGETGIPLSCGLSRQKLEERVNPKYSALLASTYFFIKMCGALLNLSIHGQNPLLNPLKKFSRYHP